MSSLTQIKMYLLTRLGKKYNQSDGQTGTLRFVKHTLGIYQLIWTAGS